LYRPWSSLRERQKRSLYGGSFSSNEIYWMAAIASTIFSRAVKRHFLRGSCLGNIASRHNRLDGIQMDRFVFLNQYGKLSCYFWISHYSFCVKRSTSVLQLLVSFPYWIYLFVRAHQCSFSSFKWSLMSSRINKLLYSNVSWVPLFQLQWKWKNLYQGNWEIWNLIWN